MTTATMKVPLQQCRVHDPELIQFQLAAAEGEGEPAKVQRRWTMLAHTGQIVDRWWGKLVLDLAGAQFRQRLALLMDHDTEKRLGYSTSVKRTERGLEASGNLLKNDLAGLVLEESREGFPWEASLMAVPRRIQKLDVGENAEVNGQTVTGPAHIFREWLVRELTLTALGADDRTATEAFAQEGELLDVELETRNETMTTHVPAPPANTPPPATPAPAIDEAKLKSDTIAAERKRVNAILGAADESQAELANKLVTDGVDEATALSQLLADAKRRLAAARSLTRDNTEPLAGGNGAGPDGTGSGDRTPAELKLPEGPDRWKEEFAAREELRKEFVTPADYFAFRKFSGPVKDIRTVMLSASECERLGLGTTGPSPLTMRSVRSMYFERLSEEFDALWAPTLATKQTSDQPFEEYAMLGAVPKMVKWEGERTLQALRGFSTVLINDDWTTGFPVRRKDLRRDKSEQIRTRAGELATVVARHPEELITQLLVANGTAYDGVAFFHASSHVIGDSGTIKNALGTGDGLAGAASPTSAQMAANILIGYQTLKGFKNDQGHPVNQAVRRIAVMVPINMIAAAYGAIDVIFTSAGVSNPLKAIKGLQVEIIENPRLTTTNRFYMFALSGGYQPLLWQEEWNEPEELGPNSEHAIKTNECQFNHGWTGAVGYGEFRKALQLTTS